MNVSFGAMPLDTDHEIIAGLRSQERERAAYALVQRHQSFVYRTAVRFLGSGDDAQDATQEVFIRALGNIDKFRGESALTTWLYSITRNVCSGMRRRAALRSFLRLDSAVENTANDSRTDRIVEDSDFDRRFWAMLDTLPTKQRETFVLRYIEELSYEEISQMLGTSVGGLKANYFQAAKKLASLLGGDGLGERR